MRWLDWLREKPILFHRRDGEISAGLSQAFSIAHNAGDALDTAQQALGHGADIIEIDAMTRSGRLVAGHPRHAWIFSRTFLWTIELEAAWGVAARGQVVKLDLKESSAAYRRKLFAFLRDHRETPVFAVTRDVALLQSLARETPWVGRVLSVTKDGLRAAKADPAVPALIDGISGHPDRFGPDTVNWLRKHHLVSMSSVVNSVRQADDLLCRGVNGIITDNLALIEAIARDANRDVHGLVFGKRKAP